MNTVSYIQYITTYRDSIGYDISRTTTLAIQYINSESNLGWNVIKQGFDEEAAIAILARVGMYKAENDYDYKMVNWLDRSLIKLCSRYASYMMYQPQSWKLPTEFKYFPQFIFYLRRSQFVRTFGYSPDETAYYRYWLCRSNCIDTLTMIQPTLMKYQVGMKPIPVSLDISACEKDVVLLLDTFFHVVKWTGENVAFWRDDKLRDDGEWLHLGEFLDKAEVIIELFCETFKYFL